MPSEDTRQLFERAGVALEQRRLDDASLQRALSLPQVREPLHRLLHKLAGDRKAPVRDDAEVDHPHEDYSPQAAAEQLGVSRKLVNKLIDTGQLEHYRLPGSSHKKIPAGEVARLLAEREAMRHGIDRIVDDLADDGGD